MTGAPVRRGKTAAGAIVAVLVGFLMMLGIGEIATRVLYPHWSEFDSLRFTQMATLEGHRSFWIGTPGFDGRFAQNNGDFRHAIRINDFGLRNPEPVAAADGRVWMLGDSMTFGWGVERADSFTARVADLTGLPTYNVAGPGDDVCGYQALADRMPRNVRPLLVVVGLIVENDLQLYDCRARAAEEKAAGGRAEESAFDSWVSVKQALLGNSALYNVLVTAVKRVPWLLDALTRIGLIAKRHEVKNVFDAAETEARIRTTAAAVDGIRRFLPDGTPMVVLVVPARFEIRDRHPYFRETRTGVVSALRARGLATIDLYPDFEKAGFEATHFVHDGHWSAAGHAIAAAAIARWIAANRDALDLPRNR